jgi:hypothetical protein
MSTNTKVSNSWFKVVPLSAVVLLVGLVLVFLFNSPPAIVQPARVAQPVGSGLERGWHNSMPHPARPQPTWNAAGTQMPLV